MNNEQRVQKICAKNVALCGIVLHPSCGGMGEGDLPVRLFSRVQNAN
jgi:hypothetical protein